MRYTRFSTTPTRLLLLFVLVIMLLAIVSSVQANTRTTGGGDLPYYARIEAGYVVHNGDWAAIIFYRPPDCVPNDFNLLDFYDFYGAVDCGPPTTDGFIIWDGEPGFSSPIQVKLRGLGAVPVWFVSWPALRSAMDDDDLTMPELESLPSLLEGSAAFYSETLHPSGEANNSMINLLADGYLPDGRSFHVHSTESNGVLNTQIVIQ